MVLLHHCSRVLYDGFGLETKIPKSWLIMTSSWWCTPHHQEYLFTAHHRTRVSKLKICLYRWKCSL